jgi:hypothetical protein
MRGPLGASELGSTAMPVVVGGIAADGSRQPENPSRTRHPPPLKPTSHMYIGTPVESGAAECSTGACAGAGVGSRFAPSAGFIDVVGLGIAGVGSNYLCNHRFSSCLATSLELRLDLLQSRERPCARR